MSVFVDTNVLLRTVQPLHELHEVALYAIKGFISNGEAIMLTPQIIAEFWNVATRPLAANGFGFTHEKALQELKRIESLFSLLEESADVYNEWKRLVGTYRVTGVKTHDARLVAAMNVSQHQEHPYVQRRRFHSLQGNRSCQSAQNLM